MLRSTQNWCATCARGGRAFVGRYRDFLLEPGTLLTLASLLLLAAAMVHRPGGIFTSGSLAEAGTPLYVAAALVGSVYIWFSAVMDIKDGDFTADIPVSIATAAAIAIGEYSAAAVVAVLLLVGGMLEEFVAARAGRALEALESLLPETVTVRREGGDKEVALEEVEAGETVLIRPGGRVAVDGRVLSGGSSVNQAAITGESVPVEKGAGDEVFAGTLNETGALTVQAAKVGAQTTLGRIRTMVEQAQQDKAPVERTLDRYAKVYTPVALLLGALLWWWSGDVMRAITMLIVFCPCVMVLATPTALVASIGNAALRGSLVKRGATIESASRVDAVAFDKTGTLTHGEPRLVEVVPLNGVPEPELLRMSASAEKFSEHPIGRATVRAAEERSLPVADPERFETRPGIGVESLVEGRRLLLGRPAWISSNGTSANGTSASGEGAVALADGYGQKVTELSAPGRTVVQLTADEEPAALLVYEDALRPEASDTVSRLNELGLRTVLVTGDNAKTASRIAEELGISEVHAEVLPHEKVEVVKSLQAQGRSVAFVGDGVNDGPALATAEVGVAMGLGGTDVAIETAEIGLLSDDLSRLPHLLGLSKAAMRAIRQNLVFSLGVLVLAVVLTIPGILTPVTGALLHELSSIPVIANSARLIRAR